MCTILHPKFIHINKNSVPELIEGVLNSPNIDAKHVELPEPNAEPPELCKLYNSPENAVCMQY